MAENPHELPEFAKGAPWQFRPLLLVMVDMRDWLFNYSAINLLWFVLSLTGILLPPATVALYEVAWHSYHDREPSLAQYIQGMKTYFWLSYVWALLMMVVFSLGGGAVLYFMGQELFIGIVISVAITLLCLAMLFHFIPYLILEKNGLRALKLSIFTALADPLNIVMYAILFFIFGVPSIIVIAPVMFILPIILALIGMYNLLNWLYNYERIEGNAREV